MKHARGVHKLVRKYCISLDQQPLPNLQCAQYVRNSDKAMRTCSPDPKNHTAHYMVFARAGAT